MLQDLEEGRSADPEFLKIILKNSDRLLALINDLLDLSALESGALDINITDCHPNEALQHVLERVGPVAAAKKTKIVTQVQVENLQADSKRLEQVLTNLIDNAIKYCPAESTITVKFFDDANETVLQVADNGPGIAEKYLDRLFERFYRLDKGRSRETGGTGLGLSIVKHIMQRHNGLVYAESVVGEGTTFTCRFPKAHSA